MKGHTKNHAAPNPLRRRVVRELRGDFARYAVIALLLILVIGFVSGMYVANGSMMQTFDQGGDRYRTEDGHFELKGRADPALIAGIESGEMADVRAYYTQKARQEIDQEIDRQLREQFGGLLEGSEALEMLQIDVDDLTEDLRQEAYDQAQEEIDREYDKAAQRYGLDDPDFTVRPVTVYETFFRDVPELRQPNEKTAASQVDKAYGADAEITMRVYPIREKVNRTALLSGRMPKTEGEIAIDRMHADNAGLSVGDRLTVGGAEFTITGLAAFSDYQVLMEKSTDIMFDALTFDVGTVTQAGFDRIAGSTHYTYAWLYSDAPGSGDLARPADDTAARACSDDFLKVLATQVAVSDGEIQDYTPAYANSAIHFAQEDMGSDMAMGGVLLYILVGILAFTFAITISNTIAREAPVIGTLRASGYTRRELTWHYMSLPILVIVAAALAGNILGYTVFKSLVVSMYYGSYSLPPYETVLSTEALWRTTLVPGAIMIAVNYLIIHWRLKLSPLRFLRSDLRRGRQKRAVRLPNWRFLRRFRMRVALQNIPDYLVLTVGLFFVALMLTMAIGMPDLLEHYQTQAAEMMIAPYQTILRDDQDEDGNYYTTSAAGAQRVSMEDLVYETPEHQEGVSAYGVGADSRYVSMPDQMPEDGILVSSAFAEKYRLKPGQRITLKEKYDSAQYTFTISGIVEYDGGIAMFQERSAFARTFQLDMEDFSGFFSEEPITDIPESQILTTITAGDITKMARQLNRSMGAYMDYFAVLMIGVSVILLYLLTRLIIEKNETAISMLKILGYRSGETAGIYLIPTTIVTAGMTVATSLLSPKLMEYIWRMMMLGMSGYMAFSVSPAGVGKIIAFILAGYLIAMALDYRKLRRIPMAEALKHAE